MTTAEQITNTSGRVMPRPQLAQAPKLSPCVYERSESRGARESSAGIRAEPLFSRATSGESRAFPPRPPGDSPCHPLNAISPQPRFKGRVKGREEDFRSEWLSFFSAWEDFFSESLYLNFCLKKGMSLKSKTGNSKRNIDIERNGKV